MLRKLLAPVALATFVLPTASAFAQDPATVAVVKSDEYGQYLADGQGRPLYLFTADTQGSGDTKAQVSCSEDCLKVWPSLRSEGAPEAGDGVDASMLGTTDRDGQHVVTYNGWPLYHFAKDEGSDEPSGQEIESFGGEWYLVSPKGEKVEDED